MVSVITGVSKIIGVSGYQKKGNFINEVQVNTKEDQVSIILVRIFDLPSRDRILLLESRSQYGFWYGRKLSRKSVWDEIVISNHDLTKCYRSQLVLHDKVSTPYQPDYFLWGYVYHRLLHLQRSFYEVPRSPSSASYSPQITNHCQISDQDPGFL